MVPPVEVTTVHEDSDDGTVNSGVSAPESVMTHDVSLYEGDDLALAPEVVHIGPDCCRAKFHLTSTGDEVRVCGKISRGDGKVGCSRPNHGKAVEQGQVGGVGYYTALKTKTSIDGLLSSFQTAKEWQDAEELTKATQAEVIAELTQDAVWVEKSIPDAEALKSLKATGGPSPVRSKKDPPGILKSPSYGSDPNLQPFPPASGDAKPPAQPTPAVAPDPLTETLQALAGALQL